MLIATLYLLGLAGYAIFSYIVLKVAYEAGHDGDLTLPIGAAYVVVSALFWVAAGLLLISLNA